MHTKFRDRLPTCTAYWMVSCSLAWNTAPKVAKTWTEHIELPPSLIAAGPLGCPLCQHSHILVGHLSLDQITGKYFVPHPATEVHELALPRDVYLHGHFAERPVLGSNSICWNCWTNILWDIYAADSQFPDPLLWVNHVTPPLGPVTFLVVGCFRF